MKRRAQLKKSRSKAVEIEETTTQYVTEPRVEVRKPATLAQALTEPAVVVIKPQTTARRVRRVTRRAA